MVVLRDGKFLIRRDSFGRYKLMVVCPKGIETSMGTFPKIEEAKKKMASLG